VSPTPHDPANPQNLPVPLPARHQRGHRHWRWRWRWRWHWHWHWHPEEPTLGVVHGASLPQAPWTMRSIDFTGWRWQN